MLFVRLNNNETCGSLLEQLSNIYFLPDSNKRGYKCDIRDFNEITSSVIDWISKVCTSCLYNFKLAITLTNETREAESGKIISWQTFINNSKELRNE